MSGSDEAKTGFKPEEIHESTAFIGKKSLSGSLLENISTVAPPSTISRISVPLQSENQDGRKY
jgi:hypothetical protein